MGDGQVTVDTFPAYCREKGLKCTAQRLAVFSVLFGRRTHPSVDEVWKGVRRSVPTVTRDSVYRILNEFSEQGLVARLDALTSARYDTCTDPHAHFICESCGSVTDYPLPEGMALPEGIRGERRHLELRVIGVCERCLRKVK